jgi:hypothetical protein
MVLRDDALTDGCVQDHAHEPVRLRDGRAATGPSEGGGVPLPDRSWCQRAKRYVEQRRQVQAKVPLTGFPPSNADLQTVAKNGTCVVAESLRGRSVVDPRATRHIGLDKGEPAIGISLCTEGVRCVLTHSGRPDERCLVLARRQLACGRSQTDGASPSEHRPSG